MIRSRCVRLLTSTHLELSRNPRLIFKDGFEVRLTGKWVSDHGAQGDDGNPFVLTHFFNYRPRDKAMAAFVLYLLKHLVSVIDFYVGGTREPALHQSRPPRRRS